MRLDTEKDVNSHTYTSRLASLPSPSPYPSPRLQKASSPERHQTCHSPHAHRKGSHLVSWESHRKHSKVPLARASGAVLLCSTMQNRSRRPEGLQGSSSLPGVTSHNKILPSCHPTTQGSSLLCPLLHRPSCFPQLPQASSTSPAPQGFANPLDQNLCSSAVSGPSRVPASSLDVSYCPPQPCPSKFSALPASPASSGPPHQSPQLQGLHPPTRIFSGFLPPKFPQGAFPLLTPRSGIPPTSSSLRHLFPFSWSSMDFLALPLTPTPCSPVQGMQGPPPSTSLFRDPSQLLISLLGTPDPSSPLRNPPRNHHPGFATQGLPPTPISALSGPTPHRFPAGTSFHPGSLLREPPSPKCHYLGPHTSSFPHWDLPSLQPHYGNPSHLHHPSHPPPPSGPLP